MALAQLLNQRDIPSPFTRIISTGYYDGLTEGVAECCDGSFVVLLLLDWDDQQDVRVFGVFDIQNGERVQKAKELFLDKCTTSSLIFSPESMFKQAMAEVMEISTACPDYIIAAEDILKQLLRCAAFPKSDPERDWFSYLEIERGNCQ